MKLPSFLSLTKTPPSKREADMRKDPCHGTGAFWNNIVLQQITKILRIVCKTKNAQQSMRATHEKCITLDCCDTIHKSSAACEKRACIFTEIKIFAKNLLNCVAIKVYHKIFKKTIVFSKTIYKNLLYSYLNYIPVLFRIKFIIWTICPRPYMWFDV